MPRDHGSEDGLTRSPLRPYGDSRSTRHAPLVVRT